MEKKLEEAKQEIKKAQSIINKQESKIKQYK
jgi:hypothetical protein